VRVVRVLDFSSRSRPSRSPTAPSKVSSAVAKALISNRFNRAPATTIRTDAAEIQLPPPEAGVSLALRATSGKPLQEDEKWALVGEGYKSDKDAWEAGSRIQDILVLMLAKLRIGANFGNRAPIHGQYIETLFTPEGLQHTQQLLTDEGLLRCPRLS
jgi:hypothetical protein